MRIFRLGMGAIFWALALMTTIPSDRPTDILQGWFRAAGLPRAADILGYPAVVHVIQYYAVWVLIFIGLVCFAWPLISTFVTRPFLNDNTSVHPDMKVSDAIDYIVNDSKAVLEKPKQHSRMNVVQPSSHISVVGAQHTQARRELNDKLNIGKIKAWGRRQISTHIPNQFELSIREIPGRVLE